VRDRSMLRRRFWVESIFAVLTVSIAILTVVLPSWAEVLFGIDPDQGGGAFEVGVTVVVASAAVGFALAARGDWRNSQAKAEA
jgi:hypothetical protein